MKKGVAVPYIIAVILGIAVIGIIGYYFFYISGNITTEATLQDCQRKLTVYCSVWLAEGYSGKNSDRLGAWSEYAPGCTVIGVPVSGLADCNRALGRETTGTPGVTSPTQAGVGGIGQSAKSDGTCDRGVPCDESGRKICRVSCA